jgi:predicted nucleic-acid-binding protein
VIALDTNVLVRYLVRDDAAQARRAKALVDGLDTTGERAHVSDVVLCELVWVLRRAYGFDRARIGAVVRQLLAARQLAFSSTDRLWRAARAFDAGKGDFADYVIHEHGRDAGCGTLVTFDKVLCAEDGFAAP